MTSLELLLFALIFFIGGGIGSLIAHAVARRHRDRSWWDAWMP